MSFLLEIKVQKYVVGYCIPKTMNTAGLYLLLSSCFYINLYAVCELTYSKISQKLIVGAWCPLYTIYRVTWYLRLLALSILACSPNMSSLSRLVSDNSGSFAKLELGHRPPQPPLRKIFLQRVRILVRGYLCVRFDLPSSINFRDISGFPKLGAHNPY